MNLYEFFYDLFHEVPRKEVRKEWEKFTTPVPVEDRTYDFDTAWYAIHLAVKHGVSLEHIFSVEPPEGRKMKHLKDWLISTYRSRNNSNNTKGDED